MSKYILTYVVNDHPDAGGGPRVEEFKSAEEMHKNANDLLTCKVNGPDYFQEMRGFVVETEFSYEPQHVVTQFKPVEK